MSLSIRGDSCSDADTQEPVNPAPPPPAAGTALVERIEESDVEEVAPAPRKGGSPQSVDGKMRQIIERINADSERSDDDDPLAPDAKVDFGDDEEEDVDDREAVAEVKAVDDVKEAKQAADIAEVQEGEQEEPAERDKAVNKGPVALATKKKQRARKEKTPPVKSIKKESAPKAKTKVVKGKKKDLLQSTKLGVENKLPAEKPATKTLLKGKKSNDLDAETKAGEKASAGTGRSKTASKSSADSKAAKPKKTIVKEEKKQAKKPLVKKDGKKSASPETQSGKGPSASAKVPAKAKKSEAVPKVKVEKKPAKAKGRSKTKKVLDDDSEEANMAIDSEGGSDAESDSVASSEQAYDDSNMDTPGSKLPVLGNLACSSRDGDTSALLEHAVQQLGKYSIVSYGGDSPDCKLHAYIIGKDTKRGWGVLQALACDVPLVSDDWLSTSISEGKWQPLDAYRSDRFGQSPRSVDSGLSGNPILEGLRVKVVCEGKDSYSVRKLLSLCGARVAETRVDLIVNDTGKAVVGYSNVSKKWLADSIEAGMAIEYEPFLV